MKGRTLDIVLVVLIVASVAVLLVFVLNRPKANDNQVAQTTQTTTETQNSQDNSSLPVIPGESDSNQNTNQNRQNTQSTTPTNDQAKPSIQTNNAQTNDKTGWFVRLGTYNNWQEALSIAQDSRLIDAGYVPQVDSTNNKLAKVFLGPFDSEAAATEALNRWQKDYPDASVEKKNYSSMQNTAIQPPNNDQRNENTQANTSNSNNNVSNLANNTTTNDSTGTNSVNPPVESDAGPVYLVVSVPSGDQKASSTIDSLQNSGYDVSSDDQPDGSRQVTIGPLDQASADSLRSNLDRQGLASRTLR